MDNWNNTLYSVDPVQFAREALCLELDAKQAEVVRSKAKKGILNCTRQWGKSTVTAVMALHRALFVAGCLIVVVSRSERQSAEWLRKVKGFAMRLGIRPRGDGDNSVSLLLPNGSRIVGLPGKGETIRGFSGVEMMLIDEAAQVTEEVYAAVRPMRAVSNGDLWLMSTPNGRQGFFWREWSQGQGWLRMSVPATECPRISAEFLEDERLSLGERKFRQEYLCEFTEAEGALLDPETIASLFTGEFAPLEI